MARKSGSPRWGPTGRLPGTRVCVEVLGMWVAVPHLGVASDLLLQTVEPDSVLPLDLEADQLGLAVDAERDSHDLVQHRRGGAADGEEIGWVGGRVAARAERQVHAGIRLDHGRRLAGEGQPAPA